MSSNQEFKAFEEVLSKEDFETLKSAISLFLASDKISKWDDNVFSVGFSAETAQYCYEHLSLKEGDVLVATYPKTGTFWIRDIIHYIISQDEKELELTANSAFTFQHLELAPSTKFAVMDKLPVKRGIKSTHMSAALVNVEKYTNANAKIVCVLRNPKDQMVSFYEFLPKVPPGQVEPMLSMVSSGWDKYFDHVIQGDLPVTMKPGEWYPDFILSWYKHKDNKNVYFMYYEDMIKDLEGQIKQLAEFLDAPVTSERTRDIAAATRFDSMRKRNTSGDDFMSRVGKANMRKGGIGGWKDYFTVSQSEKIDSIIEEKLKDTDINFTYE